MNTIEKHIHEHFSRQAETGTPDGPITEATPSDIASAFPSIPASSLPLGPAFAKVNSVVEGSPAESAGLKAGDEIRNFGYVNISNHDGLKRVAECVQGNEGVSYGCVTFGNLAKTYSAMFWLRFLGLATVADMSYS